MVATTGRRGQRSAANTRRLRNGFRLDERWTQGKHEPSEAIRPLGVAAQLLRIGEAMPDPETVAAAGCLFFVYLPVILAGLAFAAVVFLFCIRRLNETWFDEEWRANRRPPVFHEWDPSLGGEPKPTLPSTDESIIDGESGRGVSRREA
jgi:hypothetical protein